MILRKMFFIFKILLDKLTFIRYIVNYNLFISTLLREVNRLKIKTKRNKTTRDDYSVWQIRESGVIRTKSHPSPIHFTPSLHYYTILIIYITLLPTQTVKMFHDVLLKYSISTIFLTVINLKKIFWKIFLTHFLKSGKSKNFLTGGRGLLLPCLRWYKNRDDPYQKTKKNTSWSSWYFGRVFGRFFGRIILSVLLVARYPE